MEGVRFQSMGSADGVRVILLGALLALGSGCSPDASDPGAAIEPPGAADILDGRPLPDGAQPEIVQQFRYEETLEFSPADGQGVALVDPPGPVQAGARGAWTLTYTAGELGVALGGSLVLQVSPFWEWSDPQPFDPELPGFTRVESDAAGTRLRAVPCGTGCLHIGVEETALPPGAQIRIRYGGSGAGAARADRFAESEEEFFLRVDGDGDGLAAPIANPPGLEILPGPARALHVVVPSTARVGDEVFLHLAALDADWNAARDFQGEVQVVDAGGLEGLPERIQFRPEHGGHRRLAAVASRPGPTWVRVAVEPWAASFRSNPLEIADREAAPPARIVWADLHGHSGRSDGTGTPAEFLRYARDVAALDAAALTDHDHFGLRFLDRTPALWQEIRETTDAFHEPGRFVTVLGYEWTSWLFGHRHVLYFDGRGDVIGSTDRESDEPEELWERLAGRAAMTVAHHPGGGPIPVDWSVPPHPELEPVVEIVSVHGSSECLRCPAGIYSPVAGASVREALDRGYRLGIIGSGDTHDGHPGLGSPENATIGLAALLADRLDRPSLLAALRSRRAYATSGPRLVLHFEVSGTPMGGVLRVAEPTQPRQIRVRALGSAPVSRIDVVKGGEVWFSQEGAGSEVLELRAEDREPVRPGEYLYARVIQEDGGLAWSSPVWVEATAGE